MKNGSNAPLSVSSNQSSAKTDKSEIMILTTRSKVNGREVSNIISWWYLDYKDSESRKRNKYNPVLNSLDGLSLYYFKTAVGESQQTTNNA